MLVFVEASYLEGARFPTVVPRRDDVIGVSRINGYAILEPSHRGVRDAGKVAFQ